MKIETKAIEEYKNEIGDKNEHAFIPYIPGKKNDWVYLAGGILTVGGIFPYIGKKIYNKVKEDLVPLKDIIQIPDRIFTGNLVLAEHIDGFEGQHLKDFDFHFFKHSVNISEIHSDKITINQVNISCNFNPDNPVDSRPCVTDFFPRTTFVDENYKGSFKLYFNGGSGINSEFEYSDQSINISANAKAKLESESDFVYNYNPKIASISGFMNGSSINYTFRKAEKADSPYPTGALEIFGVFMRPRNVEEVFLETSVTINNWPIPIKGVTKLILTKSEPDTLVKGSQNHWSLISYLKDKFPFLFPKQNASLKELK